MKLQVLMFLGPRNLIFGEIFKFFHTRLHRKRIENDREWYFSLLVLPTVCRYKHFKEFTLFNFLEIRRTVLLLFLQTWNRILLTISGHWSENYKLIFRVSPKTTKKQSCKHDFIKIGPLHFVLLICPIPPSRFKAITYIFQSFWLLNQTSKRSQTYYTYSSIHIHMPNRHTHIMDIKHSCTDILSAYVTTICRLMAWATVYKHCRLIKRAQLDSTNLLVSLHFKISPLVCFSFAQKQTYFISKY